jgi:CheY-like chemotaxis protein
MTNAGTSEQTITPGRRLLWVDDQILGLKTFVDALNENGFNVSTAASTAEAVRLAEQQHFDVCLVDIRMPDVDGIECLRIFHRLMPEAKLAALSSYHYLERYRQQLLHIGFDVQIIDKDFPDPLAPDFSAIFLDPIRQFAKEGVTQTIRSQDELAKLRAQDDPFDIPLVEFNRLPLSIKDQLRLRAGQLAKDAIQKAFREGKVWVMLCGNNSVIRAQASHLNEIPTDEETMEFAKSQQRPAYFFWNEVSAEDMWTACEAVSHYPTVTLEFEKSQITVHFDTGAPWTFFSYEDLLSLEIVRPTTNFGPSYRKGFRDPYWAASLVITAEIRDQRSGETQTIEISGQAVRDWEQSPFAKLCRETCPGFEFEPGEPWKCPARKALIGRNLLIENALVLVLDGKTRQTRLET